jgi:predicted secreted protein
MGDMRKSLKAIIAVSSAVLMASGLLSTPVNAANKDLTLVVTQLPAQVRLIPGESIALSLSTNATTGYTWDTKVSGDKKSVKVFQGVYAAPAATGMVGVPGTTIWQITAKSVGKAVVTVVTTSPGGAKSNVGKLTVIVMAK